MLQTKQFAKPRISFHQRAHFTLDIATRTDDLRSFDSLNEQSCHTLQFPLQILRARLRSLNVLPTCYQ